MTGKELGARGVWLSAVECVGARSGQVGEHALLRVQTAGQLADRVGHLVNVRHGLLLARPGTLATCGAHTPAVRHSLPRHVETQHSLGRF